MIKYKEIIVKCISINNPHLNIDYKSIKKGYNYTARLYKDYDDISEEESDKNQSSNASCQSDEDEVDEEEDEDSQK